MCPKDLPASENAPYLIVLQDCVVLQDIADTIAEFDPDATILCATEAAGALNAVAPLDQLSVVFVEAAPQAFAATALAGAVAARGGRVIYLGEAAETADGKGPWIVLQRPFPFELVLRHLAALRPS